MQITVEEELFVSNNNNWTLATRFGQMLAEAEVLYGRRDEAWTFAGIEFWQGPPNIWFPLYIAGTIQHIVIRLSPFTITQPIRAYWQLAHEVVHLITPEVGLPATYLEEGMTTYFQTYFMKKHFGFQQAFNDATYQ